MRIQAAMADSDVLVGRTGGRFPRRTRLASDTVSVVSARGGASSANATRPRSACFDPAAPDDDERVVESDDDDDEVDASSCSSSAARTAVAAATSVGSADSPRRSASIWAAVGKS